MELTEKHVHYWHKNLVMSGILLAIWFVATFVVAWYARPLSEMKIFGWPFSFYMAAQGSLIIYVVIIGIYALQMRKYDIEYGVAEGEED